ncbi:hypothetical protein SLNSH_23655, partial [Alsobacter soli]
RRHGAGGRAPNRSPMMGAEGRRLTRRMPLCPSGGAFNPAPLLDHPQFPARLASLTEMQRIVLALIALGRLNKQIAHICGIGEATVKAHVSAVLRHLGTRSRTEAAVSYAVFLERKRLLCDADESSRTREREVWVAPEADTRGG